MCILENLQSKGASRNWFEQNTDTVRERRPLTISCDIKIHTNRSIKTNRPDIATIDYSNGKSLLLTQQTLIEKFEKGIKIQGS